MANTNACFAGEVQRQPRIRIAWEGHWIRLAHVLMGQAHPRKPDKLLRKQSMDLWVAAQRLRLPHFGFQRLIICGGRLDVILRKQTFGVTRDMRNPA